jgi:hypothetical protein
VIRKALRKKTGAHDAYWGSERTSRHFRRTII